MDVGGTDGAVAREGRREGRREGGEGGEGELYGLRVYTSLIIVFFAEGGLLGL